MDNKYISKIIDATKDKGKELKEAIEDFQNILEGIEFINDYAVYVGIPQEENEREEEENELTNAELLYIHTNGSSINNLSSRPIIEPAIENDQERINSMMDKALKYAMDGEKSKAIDQLKKTGMRAQNVCRAWFTNEKNGWPPDKPATIERKKKKHKSKNYIPRTLIDTAQMKNAITYFIESPEGRSK